MWCKQSQKLSPDQKGRGLLMAIFLLVFFVLLPHGELTASGESGLNSQKRQNPAIEDIPGGKYADENQ